MNRGGESAAETVGGHRRTLTGAAVAISCLPGAAIIGTGLAQAGGTGIDLCMVHRTTGYWCPLCGGTRATRALIGGDVQAAIGYNPFALIVLALAAALAARWLLARRRGAPRPLITAGEAVAVFATAGVFAVVRNLPGMWAYLGPLLGPPG